MFLKPVIKKGKKICPLCDCFSLWDAHLDDPEVKTDEKKCLNLIQHRKSVFKFMNIVGGYMTQTQLNFPDYTENLDISRKTKNIQLSYARGKYCFLDLRDKTF